MGDREKLRERWAEYKADVGLEVDLPKVVRERLEGEGKGEREIQRLLSDEEYMKQQEEKRKAEKLAFDSLYGVNTPTETAEDDGGNTDGKKKKKKLKRRADGRWH
jgi:hypothetical protein